jgi:hypothetical protein
MVSPGMLTVSRFAFNSDVTEVDDEPQIESPGPKSAVSESGISLNRAVGMKER